MKIGIVIPTYQEEKNIKKIFYKFSRYKKINFFFVLLMEVMTTTQRYKLKNILKETIK